MIDFKKQYHWLSKKTSHKFNFQIWLLLFIFVILSALALWRSFSDLEMFSQGYSLQQGQMVKKITEIHGRNGNIVAINGNVILLEVDLVNGQGSESIEVEILPETEVLEIQIPEYLSAQLRKKMQSGEDIITRVKSQPEKLQVGQRVLVVSQKNMIGQKKVVSSRIEYTVIIQT